MLDIHLIRESPQVVRDSLQKRGAAEKLHVLEEIIAKDLEWRELLKEVDALKHRRNVLGREIAEAKRAAKDTVAPQKEAAEIPKQMEAKEQLLEALRGEVDAHLRSLPNLLHEAVPVGKDDSENVERRRWGEPRKPDFELRPHGELLEALDLGDFERARKVAGAGFVYLKGAIVRLDLALMQYALDFLGKRGYTPVLPPYLLRRSAYEGLVDLGDFETVMYKVEGEELYLIATSEHAVGAMYQGEILDEDRMPLRFAGISPCFRREIGAHGVDTKGLFRMHQFNKVEQFVFCTPETSWAIHEELIANAEAIFQALQIPYRVVDCCTGDLGAVAARKYDLEAWSPRQGKYVEVVSCSNCTDWQARRLNIRVGKAGGEKRVAHTLNSTAVATSRALVAILEHFQNADGTVTVPEVLRPYMSGAETLGRAP